MLSKEMPEHPETKNARKVLGHARDSSSGFIEAFTAVRRERGAGQGAPTDEDQDLARAALVFAAAGLDSCVKHLLKEAIHTLCSFDPKVSDLLNKFVRKVISAESPERLAVALLADEPKKQLIDDYIYELTGSSLQSFDELAKAAGALGVKLPNMMSKKSKLVEIFKARNKIIHELDVNFEGGVGQRERNPRSKATLADDAKLLLEVAEEFVNAVDEKLENQEG